MNNLPIKLLSLGIFFGTINLVNLRVEAQTPSTMVQPIAVIYVNPQTGNDQKGDGGDRNPFKTITQALMSAKSGTVIKLAPGNYSKETGETFPLIIRKNITIQGNTTNQGKDVIIEGNGTYISPTSAGQHVAIVATEKAGTISGITVINPHSQGYGIWIESANPTLNNNSFINSGNGGVSVNGESQALISDNYFYNIQGNGLVIYGKSQPKVTNNKFFKTGFGVSILQNSAPILTGNRISETRIGVILQNSAQGILRGNTIEYSSEDGVVTVSNSWVDLGKKNEPGNNIFASNKGVDIRNLSKEQIIPIFGNSFNSTAGLIDLSGNSKRVEPIDPNQNKPQLTLNSNPNNTQIIVRKPLPDLQPVGLPPEAEIVTYSPPTINNNSGNLPPPRNNSQTNSIPITIINPPSSNATLNQAPIPVTNINPTRKNLEELITVIPNFNNNRNLQPTFKKDIIPVPITEEIPITLTPPPVEITIYRVMVDPLNDLQKKEIKKLYPQAFLTTYNGQSMWQIASFEEQSKAEKLLETVNEIGISGLIVR
jgi:parallel beta-helix repeat protein